MQREAASEGRLSEIFGVARNTVRLALQRLDKAHLVEHEKGNSTYVIFDNEIQWRDRREEISPLEPIETRLAIEPHIVKLAIRKASNRNLQRLEVAHHLLNVKTTCSELPEARAAAAYNAFCSLSSALRISFALKSCSLCAFLEAAITSRAPKPSLFLISFHRA